MTKVLLSFLAGVVIGAVGFVLFAGSPAQLGSVGSQHYNQEQFYGGIQSHVVIGVGSTQALPTAATTTTITAAQICSGDVITWTPATNNATATFDTTANIQNTCLASNGNSVKVRILDTSSTGQFNIVAATNETMYHVNEVATTTPQTNVITSSTPVTYEFVVSAISTTSTVSTTMAVFQQKYLTP